MSIVALHEAAHSAIARILGVPVVHAIAAGGNPHVRTRSRRGSTDWLKRLAVIDLAGATVEDDPHCAAAETDRQNAFGRCRRVIALEDGVGVDELDDIQLADASALYQHLAAQAAALVKENFRLIGQVAHRLDDAGELSGAAIDAIILDARS